MKLSFFEIQSPSQCVIVFTALFSLFLVEGFLPFSAYAEKRPVPVTSPYDGWTIRTISVEVRSIFDEPDLSWFYETANNLKIETKKHVVREELLFHEGETYTQVIAYESERRLRQRRIFQSVQVIPTPVGDKTVDVLIRVQDTWTFVPQGTFSQGGGASKKAIGLSESDLFGYGKRAEVLVQEVDQRRDTQIIWDDPRLWGTNTRLLGAYFDREDGSQFIGFVGNPYRSVSDPMSWGTSVEDSDIVGRLYQNGSERYIFRKDSTDFAPRYSFAPVRTELVTERISFGANFSESKFSQADRDDYKVLNLDPSRVSNDLAGLPENRRYNGPTVGYDYIEADYISLAYIDRFERVEDYNLGSQFSAEAFLAPKVFDSLENAAQLLANHTWGYRYSDTSFLRLEAGASSRFVDGTPENSLVRGEAKYYNVLGSVFIGDRYMGRHTLASTFFFDYGNRLDRDREFLIGSSNGLRGYEARAFSGDKRLCTVIEDRLLLAEDVFKLFSLGGTIFFDGGGASRDTLGNILSNRFYSDIGVGIRLGFPRSSGGGIIRFDVALPLRDGADGTDSFQPRFTVSAGQVFGANTTSEAIGPQKANVTLGLTD